MKKPRLKRSLFFTPLLTFSLCTGWVGDRDARANPVPQLPEFAATARKTSSQEIATLALRMTDPPLPKKTDGKPQKNERSNGERYTLLFQHGGKDCEFTVNFLDYRSQSHAPTVKFEGKPTRSCASQGVIWVSGIFRRTRQDTFGYIRLWTKRSPAEWTAWEIR